MSKTSRQRSSSSRRCQTSFHDYQKLEPRQLLACDTLVGNLGVGIAVTDDATGMGHILYSTEAVQNRFTALNGTAQHLIAVRLDGLQWQYNNNSQWTNFAPLESDVLVAEVNFDSDTAQMLSGQSAVIEGIQAGYQEGDLWIVADQYAGVANEGEFDVDGTCFEPADVGSDSESESKLAQLGLATLKFESIVERFPHLATFSDSGNPQLSWRVQLLPFLGLGDLYSQFNLDEPWNSPNNHALIDQMPDAFISPNFNEAGKTVFQAIAGEQTMFPLESRTIGFGHVTDGSSNTILYAEVDADRAVEWTRPVDLIFDEADPTNGLGNISGEGFAAVFADRSTSTIPNTVDPANLSNMIQRNDGENVDFSGFDAYLDVEVNLRQIALAAHNYESAHLEFPAHAIYAGTSTPLLSWRVSILPYIEQNNLYEQFDLDEPWNSPHNLSLIPLMPRYFATPGLANGVTNYLGVSGPNTMFELTDDGASFGSITDGTTNTIFIVQADLDQAVPWTQPTDLLFDPNDPFAGLNGNDADGFFATFADADVSFVPDIVTDSNLTNLMNPQDGQVVDLADIDPYEPFQRSLRQLALGALNYESAHMKFPAHASYGRFTNSEVPLLSWRVTILPFIEQNNLYDMFNHDEPWDSPHNLALLPLMPTLYATPGVANGLTVIQAATGEKTMFPIDEDGVSFGSITDGPGNTALFFETNADSAVEWTRPMDIDFDIANPRNSLGEATASGFHIVTAEGAIQFIHNTVSDDIVGNLAQRNDGTPFATDYLPPPSAIEQNSTARNNLRQLALAALNHESATMRFPSHAIYSERSDDGVPLLSWRVQILPFMGHSSLYDQFHLDEPWDSPHNLALVPLMPREFAHPQAADGMTLFQAITGEGTAFPITWRGTRISSFTDGTSNSILFAEVDADRAVVWTKPQDLSYNDADPSDGLGEIVFGLGNNVAFADGSSHFISSCVGTETLRALQLINDGNVIGDPVFICVGGTVADPQGSVDIGATNNGIAVDDLATGPGFIMYSAGKVHNRFSPKPFATTSDHLIAIRYDTASGSWQYNDNSANWYSFPVAPGDRLLAAIDFDDDTISAIEGIVDVFVGMSRGYSVGNLVFAADSWNGTPNDGEFQVFGTSFGLNQPLVSSQAGNTGNGIAVDDDATGTAYVMFSGEKVRRRFANRPPIVSTSEHFIAVRYDSALGMWQYNDNTTSWHPFAITTGDRLVAELDLSNDTVTSLQGATGTLFGMYQGFIVGDLEFEADRWAGAANAGEFRVSGTYFEIPDKLAVEQVDVGATRNGIAVDDNATGSGFVLYSSEVLKSRFSAIPPFVGTNDHFIAVRYDSGFSSWQYNDNTVNWHAFSIAMDDRLVAAIDFDNDIVTALRGEAGTENGIDIGFLDGDLTIFANQWAGVFNDGEFGISGNVF